MTLLRFLSAQPATGWAERLRIAVGAAIGIFVTAAVSTAWAGPVGDLPLLIAPMGASAVLLFGVPASPLAQPWPVLAGNISAALVGVTVARLVPAPLPAAALAIGLALAAMGLLRCVHPPGGAVALTAVLGGPHVAAAGYHFAMVPVALNSVLLVAAALAYNNLTGRSYPHRAHPPAHAHPPLAAPALTPEDYDEVLADYGEAIDIGRDDLERLFTELLGRAQRRP